MRVMTRRIRVVHTYIGHHAFASELLVAVLVNQRDVLREWQLSRKRYDVVRQIKRCTIHQIISGSVAIQ